MELQEPANDNFTLAELRAWLERRLQMRVANLRIKVREARTKKPSKK